MQLGILEEAIAAAFGRPLDELRKASALLDVGALVAPRPTTARSHRRSPRWAVPVSASCSPRPPRAEGAARPGPARSEDKLDGIRAQAHVTRRRGPPVRARPGRGDARRFPRWWRRSGAAARRDPRRRDDRRAARRPRPALSRAAGAARPQEPRSRAAREGAGGLRRLRRAVRRRAGARSSGGRERRARLAQLVAGRPVRANAVHASTPRSPLEPQIEALFKRRARAATRGWSRRASTRRTRPGGAAARGSR